MVDSNVRGLKVIDIKTNEVYTVYAVIQSGCGIDYFLVYNEKLRQEKKGFIYLDVTWCMPVADNKLMEARPL